MTSKTRIGVGTDLVAIERFRDLDAQRDRQLLRRIFTAEEIRTAFAQTPAALRLAARFCAKEAIVKAMGALGIAPVPFPCIGIVRTASGAPTVRIAHTTADCVTLHISFAHSDTHAIAYAIAMVDRCRTAGLCACSEQR